MQVSLPLPSHSSALYLPKSLCAAQKRNSSNNPHHWQRLEQVPRTVVQEEYAFHGNNGPKEEGVREGRITHRFRSVAKVAAKDDPL